LQLRSAMANMFRLQGGGGRQESRAARTSLSWHFDFVARRCHSQQSGFRGRRGFRLLLKHAAMRGGARGRHFSPARDLSSWYSRGVMRPCGRQECANSGHSPTVAKGSSRPQVALPPWGRTAFLPQGSLRPIWRLAADCPHPALGQDFTLSSTTRRAQAGSSVRARSARRDARVDRSRPFVA